MTIDHRPSTSTAVLHMFTTDDLVDAIFEEVTRHAPLVLPSSPSFARGRHAPLAPRASGASYVPELCEGAGASSVPGLRPGAGASNVPEPREGSWPPLLPRGRPFLTEHDIKKILISGSQVLTIPRGAIVSPLAHDWLALKGIRVLYQ